MIPKFCPICGNVLELIEHTWAGGPNYWQWECPEQDWFEPADPPEEEEPQAE